LRLTVPSEAEIVEVVGVETEAVLILKLAPLEPAGTVTVGGTDDMAGAVLDIATSKLLDVMAFRVIKLPGTAPPPTAEPLSFIEKRFTGASVKVAFPLPPE
jgi:hypothetical protein